jgi:hypothetical protein
MENTGHSLGSNTKLQAVVVPPKPLVEEGAYKLLVGHKQLEEHSSLHKVRNKNRHMPNCLAILDPSLDHKPLDASHHHNRHQRIHSSLRYLLE